MPERGTAIIDPPWPYDASGTDRRLSGYSDKEYEPMTLDKLAGLPIARLADYAFLWTTPPFIEQAYKLVRDWEMLPVTTIYWVKTTETFPIKMANQLTNHVFFPSYGVGYWFRGVVEPIIVAKRPKMPSIRSQYLGLLSPSTDHSRKPDALHTVIEELYPKPHLELFARKARKGWTCMGYDLQGEDITLTIKKYLRSKK